MTDLLFAWTVWTWHNQAFLSSDCYGKRPEKGHFVFQPIFGHPISFTTVVEERAPGCSKHFAVQQRKWLFLDSYWFAKWTWIHSVLKGMAQLAVCIILIAETLAISVFFSPPLQEDIPSSSDLPSKAFYFLLSLHLSLVQVNIPLYQLKPFAANHIELMSFCYRIKCLWIAMVQRSSGPAILQFNWTNYAV